MGGNSIFRNFHKSVLFLMALCFPAFLMGEKLAEFQEPFKWLKMAMDESHVYLADTNECIIHIYSRKDFGHIGQFGRRGQGPEEFEYIGLMRPLPDCLFIDSGQKVSYFSKKGDFLRAMTPGYPSTGSYIPLGRNYAGKRFIPNHPKQTWFEIAVDLFDSKLKLIKEFYLGIVNANESYDFGREKKRLSMVSDCFKLDVDGDKLIVGNSTAGFSFRVFDSEGKELYEIDLPYDKRKITNEDQRAILEDMRWELGEDTYQRITSRAYYVFPKTYPAYSDFVVDDGKIYVFLYQLPGAALEIMVLDLRGNLIKKLTIPEAKNLLPHGWPYCASEGGLYFMTFNEETFKWELHFARLE